jgi:predicted dehydrogenase
MGSFRPGIRSPEFNQMIINGMKKSSRRSFLKASGLGVSAFMVVPRHVLGGAGHQAPSDRLNIASIGAGGVCAHYIESCSPENIAALCDVDDARAAETYTRYPSARRYRDFRRMLESEKDLDACIIGTPDHTHALACAAAMRSGLHVYCAKPLTRTISEARFLTDLARRTGVVTQMSTQQNASDDHRLLCEWLWSGVIGDVLEVHLWSDRPIWPQGIARPAEQPAVPAGLDWQLWLGPAPQRPYHPAYVPFAWRGWWDFGTGALGDMGCHGFDPVVTALRLTQPLSVEAGSTPMNGDSFPAGSIVQYEFPEREGGPALRFTWYDGGLKPPRPAELSGAERMDYGSGGTLYVGTKGKLITGAAGNKPRLIPEQKMRDFQPPTPTLKRSPGHYREWIDACKGGAKPGVPFEYGGGLTEMVLLGNIALRCPGRKLIWDYENMQIVGDAEANRFIREPYHNGWNL